MNPIQFHSILPTSEPINTVESMHRVSCDVFHMQKIPAKNATQNHIEPAAKLIFPFFDFRAPRSMWSRQKQFHSNIQIKNRRKISQTFFRAFPLFPLRQFQPSARCSAIRAFDGLQVRILSDLVRVEALNRSDILALFV